MYRSTEAPGAYRHKRHTIQRLSSPVLALDGTYPWLVCPDRSGESWYAYSLAHARETINAEVS
jgi:hypothetical protein